LPAKTRFAKASTWKIGNFISGLLLFPVQTSGMGFHIEYPGLAMALQQSVPVS
jgi:hypothetical protein